MKRVLRIFPLQWVGNLLLMLLAAGWLQIPDSHTWQFVLSILSGVGLVVAFFWLYTRTFGLVRSCVSRPPHWQSWLVLLVLIAVWFVVLLPIAAGRSHEGLFAGYLNSKSSPWVRAHLDYSRLVAWQERIYDCVQWILAAILLPLGVEACGCGVRRMFRGGRVFRHWMYWLAVLVFGFASSTITWALVDWTLRAGLLGQSFSVVARLGVAYTLDVLLWCGLLGLVGYWLDLDPGVG